MSLIGNFFWLIFGGLIMGLVWTLAGIVSYLSIVGIPWGRACFTMAGFNFLPFGREAINRRDLYAHDDIGTGAWGIVGNVVWFVFAGFWLALGHVVAALLNAIYIIGIPFSVQHLELAAISVAPIGKQVVSKDLAQAARSKNANARVDTLRETRKQG